MEDWDLAEMAEQLLAAVRNLPPGQKRQTALRDVGLLRNRMCQLLEGRKVEVELNMRQLAILVAALIILCHCPVTRTSFRTACHGIDAAGECSLIGPEQCQQRMMTQRAICGSICEKMAPGASTGAIQSLPPEQE
jgi:hypothetical protein